MLQHTMIFKIVPIAVLALLLTSCDCKDSEKETALHGHDKETMQEVPEFSKAICVLYPTEGNEVKGIVTFEKTDSGVVVNVNIEGLTPGKHGFHIHEFGDCSAANGTSAGGHFNPDGHEHGSPMGDSRHVGDLGNITADEQGVAKLTHLDKHLKFSGKNSIIGRSIIVHADEDDLKSQPTGNAGARVACGVIGVQK